MKEVLYSLLVNVPERDRLQYLFSHFGEFTKRVNENYQLFVSEFSFDKVRREYEEKKREYLVKLNDVFSSVQSRMIGIPVSLALTALKLSGSVDDLSLTSNLLILMAVLIYSVFIFIMLANQSHTLNSIKDEYTSQMKRMKHHFADQYDKIEDIQRELNKRYTFQKGTMWFFIVLTILLILAMGFLFGMTFVPGFYPIKQFDTYEVASLFMTFF